jgi:predicted dehydrogenase/threonine dehydrogenase-like Zn-dependent dehydrogenase
MKQLSQNLRSGALSVEEVPPPALQAGQVLVQAAYSLISAGTERTRVETGRKSLVGKALSRPDQVRQVVQSVQQVGLSATLQKVRTKLDARSPLGYSASGVVLALGPGVDGLRVGQAVACGGASAAHAEVISVPRNLCVPVPEGVPLEAAAFTTLGAIALQGLRQADLRLGEIGVVLGLGLLGQLTVQLLKAAGCLVLGYDPDASRCELALALGADAASPSEAELRGSLARLSAARGADAVLITAGTSSNRPVELGGELCRDKGKVVVVGAVGLSLPRPPYYDKELDLRLSRSYGPGRYDPQYEEKGVDYPYGYVRWTEGRNMAAFLGLLAQGKVEVGRLVSHRFPLAQAAAAYELVLGKSGGPSLGVLFDYGQTPVSLAPRVSVSTPRPGSDGRLGIGVIGAGNFAQSMLLPALKDHPQASLRGVMTLSPLENRDAAERFGFEYAASEAGQIWADPQVQAAIIATRHDSHASLAVQGLQAGKALHVEKPLALTPAELEQVQAAYQQAPQPFLNLGFNRRFAPLVVQARSLFARRSEPLAVNFRVNAGYLPLDHWTQDPQAGGGRIVGEACHFIDLVQFLAGAPIVRVYAQALPNQGRYRDDNVAITLTCADGSLGSLLYVANGDRALGKEYIEIFCQGQTALIDDYRSLTTYRGGKKTRLTQGGSGKGHRAEMLAWVQAVRSGAGEPVPFAEAVCATRASFAAVESLASGQPVVLE